MAEYTKEVIEKQMAEMQEKRRKIKMDEYKGNYDQEIYDQDNKNKYVESIEVNDKVNEDDDIVISTTNVNGKLQTYSAPKDIYSELETVGKNNDPMAEYRKPTIASRENSYQARRFNKVLSPSREDPFADGGKTPKINRNDEKNSRTYSDIMKEVSLKNQEKEIYREIREKSKKGELNVYKDNMNESGTGSGSGDLNKMQKSSRKRLSWDVKPENDDKAREIRETKENKESFQDMKTPGIQTHVWDATPMISHNFKNDTNNFKDEATPMMVSKSEFDYESKVENIMDTPQYDMNYSSGTETPIISHGDSQSRESRWNRAPSQFQTPKNEKPYRVLAATPLVSTSRGVSARLEGMTPVRSASEKIALAINAAAKGATLTPEELQYLRYEQDLDERNKPWVEEELNALFPFEGYKILPPPLGYIPIRTSARRVTSAPTPLPVLPTAIFDPTDNTYKLTEEESQVSKFLNLQPPDEELPCLKTDDLQYFDKLLTNVDERSLSGDEAREIKIMKVLLKIKNGTPQMRKAGLRQITEKAREYGAGALFNQILPLLMSPTLEDQERHLLVKVVDRILYKLDDLVRPYVHKILVVIEPLLIDEDYFARVEGREIISNLAKAAGLATMISTMRPDIDDNDEYVRNTTARAFAVVASALGIPALLPFLKAVCKSKKSWQARHTGIKIIQQIAILMGCAILPHLRALVEIIEHGLVDEQQKVRTITALGLAALAEASTPYGIESFDSVLKPLWKGIRQHRGKGLAAFLKAIGYLIPLMDAEYAFHYTKEVVVILVREFPSPDDEMKKIVLKVVKQCCSTDGVEAPYIKTEILPEFFRHFWNHRMANDKRNYRQLVDTTVEISNKVGSSYIINKVVDGLKDDNENYRKMVIETIDCILTEHGSTDIDNKLEEQLIDGVLYAFQEQLTDDPSVLDGIGTVINSLGIRTKSYIPQICGTIIWRLNNHAPKIRQYSCDLVARIAPVMKVCEEEKLLCHLGVILYEYLGEEFPEVLGSILGALKSIVNVVGMNKMTPPIKDLLPRLTPILKNRHEKVQENCIDLVGRIADRGSEHVSAREWMRICFELLELLKAHKKSIRRAAVNTFGYIAKAIGPQDVMATLLNNLKVQERQNRVCTTVAIAIVAETCSPFTILPALMNEYRLPEINVQNGCLKSLAFLFEYIGEMAKDYIYAITPLYEEALIDRDLIHRQIACSGIKHLAIGVYGFGCEDSLTHLMNLVWPNIYENSPHMVNAVMDGVDGFRLSIGSCRVLQYALQGLFHPARRVRDFYWRIYNTIYIGSQVFFFL